VLTGSLSALMLPLGGLILALHARRLLRERLRTTGIAVVGTVTSAETSSVKEWGKTVQVLTITAVDPITGMTHQFRSHRVPGQGDAWLGRQLRVYVHPSNPRRYLVDAPYPSG
jgi:hypothetical protein